MVYLIERVNGQMLHERSKAVSESVAVGPVEAEEQIHIIKRRHLWATDRRFSDPMEPELQMPES